MKRELSSAQPGKSLDVGLGLRREMLAEFSAHVPAEIDFLEVAPENWMTFGGKFGKQFRALTERHQFFCHGLSLSIGSAAPLNIEFVKRIKAFLDLHGIEVYSEHLSYCSGAGQLYDLMPIPFTDDAVRHIASRVRQVEEILERRLILENVSYYAAPGAEMSEQEFVLAVLAEAGCDLLLDVNNIYVNSVNHGYDPFAFLAAMPTERIRYLHVAGHYVQDSSLIIDTHGDAVVAPVWELLNACYLTHGSRPTLLERDFNIPATRLLLDEIEQIRTYQQGVARAASALNSCSETYLGR